MILQVIYVSSGMHYEALFYDKFRIRSTVGGDAQLLSQTHLFSILAFI